MQNNNKNQNKQTTLPAKQQKEPLCQKVAFFELSKKNKKIYHVAVDDFNKTRHYKMPEWHVHLLASALSDLSTDIKQRRAIKKEEDRQYKIEMAERMKKEAANG